ncbi:TonB-dependent receptor [Prevotella sp. KH2C16]|uniref:SusC/RagA family TonB-linked outer membrane protein n=1 Tax=Prevotella sp. KH2C16 TaxID=1855325 RepID=UPI0008F03B4C|nr:TonB-dependent receptor [Prevotella sp. KH2C16]SFF82369.1 TonB-linked outer membrane protein, SusC/RagA family [Prevotella sp. KH2C16]
MDENLKSRSFGLPERRQWKYLFAASLFLLAPVCVSAAGSYANEKTVALQQQAKKTVTGTVLDETGQPVMGATVVEKGHPSNGTITDIDGKFTLQIGEGSKISVSYVGYKSQDVAAGSGSVSVNLEEDTEGLEEVVVVGYGTAKRKDVSGAISSVRFANSTIANLPNPNAMTALSSQVAGITYRPTNSAAGDNMATMNIRGMNSIPTDKRLSVQGVNQPLLVVDGVIFSGSINEINTSDIETIDVLKDASSAAIYGSRAANGVIIITTKRGGTEKPVVRFNTQWSFSDWSTKPDMVNDKVKLLRNRFNFAKATGNQTVADLDFDPANGTILSSMLTAVEQEAWKDGTWTDWIDEMTRTGLGQKYDINVSGGSKYVHYYLSADYTRTKGVQRGDDYEKFNILSKIDVTLNSWLRMGLKGNYLSARNWGVPASMNLATWTSPLSYVKLHRTDAEGNVINDQYSSWYQRDPAGAGNSYVSPYWGTDIEHSFLWTDKQGNNQNINGVFYTQVDFPFLPGLSYRFNLNARRNYSASDWFGRPEYFVDTNSTSDMDNPSQYNNQAQGHSETGHSYTWNVDNILSYYQDFGKHHVDATLGYTREAYNNDALKFSYSDFTGTTSLGFYGADAANTKTIQRGRTRTQSIAYLARLNYNYASTYYLTFNFRRDGYSAFGDNKKWGNFYGVSGAWVLSNESFIKDNVSWLDYLKLRLSWGQNGSRSVNAYQTIAGVTTGYTWLGNDSQLVYYPTSVGNPDLQWATITKYNLGLDFAVLKNRLSGTIDLYTGRTTNMLMPRSIPYPSGFQTAWTNLGKVANKGIEITLNSVNIDGDGNDQFRWESQVVFNLSRNKVMTLYGKDYKGDENGKDVANYEAYGPDSYYALVKGSSINAAYDYKKLGIFQSKEEIDNYKSADGTVIMPTAKPGDLKFEDSNHNGKIDSEDKHVIGDTDPLFTLNFGNTLSYKNFSLYFNFRWMPSSDTHFLGLNPNAYALGGSGAQLDEVNPWTTENHTDIYPRFGYENNLGYLYWQGRGFLKLKDLVFSYNFDKKLIAPLGLQGLRAYIAGTDLFTITSWRGLDPEDGGTIAAGVSSGRYGSIGTYRTITFGLNFTF